MTELPEALRAVLERARKLTQPSPERLAELERERAADAERLRTDALERLDPPLEPAMRLAIVRDALQPTPARAELAAWLTRTRTRPLAVMWGPPRSGKTVAAAEAACTRPGSSWVSPRDIMQSDRARFGATSERWEHYLRARLLIIDQFDMVADPDLHNLAVSLAPLIDSRKARRTLILTRHTPARLRERLSWPWLREPIEHADYLYAAPPSPASSPP